MAWFWEIPLRYMKLKIRRRKEQAKEKEKENGHWKSKEASEINFSFFIIITQEKKKKSINFPFFIFYCEFSFFVSNFISFFLCLIWETMKKKSHFAGLIFMFFMMLWHVKYLLGNIQGYGIWSFVGHCTYFPYFFLDVPKWTCLSFKFHFAEL